MGENQLKLISEPIPSAQSVAGFKSLVDFAHQAGRSFTSGITRCEQKTAGQFMTPPTSVASTKSCAAMGASGHCFARATPAQTAAD